MQLAVRPVIGELDASNTTLTGVRIDVGTWKDRNPEPLFHHAAGRLEVGNVDAHLGAGAVEEFWHGSGGREIRVIGNELALHKALEGDSSGACLGVSQWRCHDKFIATVWIGNQTLRYRWPAIDAHVRKAIGNRAHDVRAQSFH